MTTIIPAGIRNPEVYLKGRDAARAYGLAQGFEDTTFMEVQAQWSDQDPNKHVTNTVRTFPRVPPRGADRKSVV